MPVFLFVCLFDLLIYLFLLLKLLLGVYVHTFNLGTWVGGKQEKFSVPEQL